MSFKIKITAKDRSTGRFMSRVHRALAKIVTQMKDEKGLTQQQIADAMGVDKSVVSRILNGESNLTLKTIGDVSWAVGLKPELTFKPIEVVEAPRANHIAMIQFNRNYDESPHIETNSAIKVIPVNSVKMRNIGSIEKPLQHVAQEEAHAY